MVIFDEIESMEARYRNRARLAKERIEQQDEKRQKNLMSREARLTKKIMIKLRATPCNPMAHIAAYLTKD
jgi:hypothetical protein